jgi:hypothetical protein
LTDAVRRPADCSGCAFWRRTGESVGACLRHAPRSSATREEIAHWPQTKSIQWCGDGVASDPAMPSLVTCEKCLFWRRRPGGVEPTDRRDRFAAWWSEAGFCARHAPYPREDPGARAYWRATHRKDSCGEGQQR